MMAHVVITASVLSASQGCTRRGALSFAGRAVGVIAAHRLPSVLRATAAPPIAVIEEELGYMPVQDDKGRTRYAPSRVLEPSTEQAVRLADHLHRSGAKFYGAFWCPHCRNQRRMFGKDGVQLVKYIECDPRGVGYRRGRCESALVDGYPTWVLGKKRMSGEHSLAELARFSDYPGNFDAEFEARSPAALGMMASAKGGPGSACN